MLLIFSKPAEEVVSLIEAPFLVPGVQRFAVFLYAAFIAAVGPEQKRSSVQQRVCRRALRKGRRDSVVKAGQAAGVSKDGKSWKYDVRAQPNSDCAF